jgi:hypothetical protein
MSFGLSSVLFNRLYPLTYELPATQRLGYSHKSLTIRWYRLIVRPYPVNLQYSS